MRLLRVELARLAARSLVVAVVILGVVGTVAVVAGTWASTRPLSGEDLARAEAAYQQQVEDWAEHGEEYLAQCLEQQELEREATGDPGLTLCSDLEPRREWFVPEQAALHTTLPGALTPFALLVVAVTFAIGTTSTAAEMSTGTISTWLTFVPDRMRVLAAKVGAAGLVAVPVGAAMLGLWLLGSWLAYDSQGLADGMTAAAWTAAAWSMLRALAVAVVAATAGAALGVLLRHAAVVLGLVLAYLVLVEGMLGGLVREVQPWLLRLSIDAFVAGGAPYWTQECEVLAEGTSCTMTEHVVSLEHGGLVLVGVLAAALLVTALVFRRRDVT